MNLTFFIQPYYSYLLFIHDVFEVLIILYFQHNILLKKLLEMHILDHFEQRKA
jgi:hypothetical protein